MLYSPVLRLQRLSWFRFEKMMQGSSSPEEEIEKRTKAKLSVDAFIPTGGHRDLSSLASQRKILFRIRKSYFVTDKFQLRATDGSIPKWFSNPPNVERSINIQIKFYSKSQKFLGKLKLKSHLKEDQFMLLYTQQNHYLCICSRPSAWRTLHSTCR